MAILCTLHDLALASATELYLPHIHHTPNAVPVMHIMESLVDTAQILAMRDELVDLESLVLVVLD